MIIHYWVQPCIAIFVSFSKMIKNWQFHAVQSNELNPAYNSSLKIEFETP